MSDHRANAVFKDDLPPLSARGFPETLEARWRAHMTAHFERKLFVSFPIAMPTENGTIEVAAVLNVNVTYPEGDKTWNRAYHASWLADATDAVAPFGRHAFWATLILIRAGSGVCSPSYLLDSGGLV